MTKTSRLSKRFFRCPGVESISTPQIKPDARAQNWILRDPENEISHWIGCGKVTACTLPHGQGSASSTHRRLFIVSSCGPYDPNTIAEGKPADPESYAIRRWCGRVRRLSTTSALNIARAFSVSARSVENLVDNQRPDADAIARAVNLGGGRFVSAD